MTTPGVEPGLSRPQRDVLTTRRCGPQHRNNFLTLLVRSNLHDANVHQRKSQQCGGEQQKTSQMCLKRKLAGRARMSPSNSGKMTAVGFEPTQLALVELESTPLDHSGKVSVLHCKWRLWAQLQARTAIGGSRGHAINSASWVPMPLDMQHI